MDSRPARLPPGHGNTQAPKPKTTEQRATVQQQQLRIGSLFSGYGGLDLAVEHIFNATSAWFVEFEEAPSKILAHHWPGVPNLGDVTKVNWSEVEQVDIITGGYPCQPFSRAGHRKGTNDERHLWPHVRDAIRVLRPRLVFLENVAGHLSLGFDRVLADLAAIGFDAQWTTLRASDIGAPHHRERLFILAHPHGERPQAQQLTRRQAAQIAGDYDRERALSWARRAADLNRQLGPAVTAWAAIHGEPPLPTVETVEYRDPELFGRRFPEMRHGINPEFAEWMMGLPDGWVTSPDIGLTRAQQLKAIGNGVCPQQAAQALHTLINQEPIP